MTTANDLTVHAMTVGAFVPLLRQLDKMLEKAEAFAVAKKLDAGVIEGLRVAPDMFTLTRQVQLTCDFAKNSAYRLAAIDPPKMPDEEQSLADLRGRVTRTIALLVVTCPCALGLATPVAIMVASGRAASVGVLFRHAAAFEHLHDLVELLLGQDARLSLRVDQFLL